MTYKDCIQYDVCECADNLQYENEERLKRDCPRFKNKADFVEVVRCKDCRDYAANILCIGVGYCNENYREMREDDFCSYGKKN